METSWKVAVSVQERDDSGCGLGDSSGRARSADPGIFRMQGYGGEGRVTLIFSLNDLRESETNDGDGQAGDATS